MELTQAQLNNIQTLTVSSGKIKADNLTAGQELQVKVAAVNPQSGEVTLEINDELVTAKLAAAKILLQIAAGQTLKLTVAQATANKVVLQLPDTLLSTITQQQALREALPKQQPITDAIIQLKALLQSASSAKLPSSIVDLAKQFIAKLPTPAQLSTMAGVKQAIKQSGVFLENTLAQISSGNLKNTLDGDIKALLLGLKSTLLKEKDALPNQAAPSTNKQTAVIQSAAQKNTSLASTIPPASAAPLTATQSQEKILPLPMPLPAPTKGQNSPALLATALAKPIAQDQITSQTTSQISTAENNDKIKSIKIADARPIDAIIMDALKNVGATSSTAISSDKTLSDKQIQQILNNLLGQRKSPSNTLTRSGGLITPPPTTQATPSTPLPTISAQQYTAKENLTAKNEIAMAAIKSQNVSDVNIPRINNLVDLIETLIKQVDSAISRTQVHQLNALQDQDANKLALSLEIPVNDDDDLHLVQMEIEKEQSKENETETVMTVSLAIDLNEIGPVYAKITLVDDRTNVVLWVERDSTFALVQESIDVLQLKLTSSGLTPDGIACHHGHPPKNRFVSLENNNGLVDERA